MKEVEKLMAGLEYCFTDQEVASRKANAARLCQEFNGIPATNVVAQEEKIREIFGSAGARVSVQANFNCDYGKNIHVGNDFLANYNLTILDIAPVHFGNNVMVGPNVDIYTVNHPLTKQGRRDYLAKASPVTIGNDVWIGGRVVITPGVTLGDNVVVASGAVVTKNFPDNVLIGGVPAKVLRSLTD